LIRVFNGGERGTTTPRVYDRVKQKAAGYGGARRRSGGRKRRKVRFTWSETILADEEMHFVNQ